MVKLVYIHGRAQEGKSELELRTYWNAGLLQGYRVAEITPQFDPEITHLPFYGNLLADLTRELQELIARGPADEQPDPIVAAMVDAMARRAKIDPQQAINADVLERGPDRWGWVQSMLGAIDRTAPWVTRYVISKVTADVAAYLNRDYIRDQVNAKVRPQLEGEPCIVVSHSLGTVVAYWVLAEMGAAAQVPLLVTAGSPLGLTEIQDRIEEHQPLVFPEGVEAWLNATDERDIVALHSKLEFFSEIENHTKVRNTGKDPHDIFGYLADPVVASRIADAFRAADETQGRR